MSSTTPRVSLYKPAGGENVNVTTDLNNNLDKIDTNLNFRVAASQTARYAISPYWEGLSVRDTDTGRTWVSNGSSPQSGSWNEILNSGATFSNNIIAASGKQINFGNASTSATYAATTGASGDDFLSERVNGDTSSRYLVKADGKTWWGPGNATQDVNLYRINSTTLGTDDNFAVGGNLQFTANSAAKNSDLSISTTVANTTTETVIAAFTIPANDMVVGAVYRITAWGTNGVAAATTPTISLKARHGGVAGALLATCTHTASSGVTNKVFKAELYFVCLTTGASGTSFGNLEVANGIAVAGANPVTNPTVIMDGGSVLTIDTTASKDLVITATWSAANASNTITVRGYAAERIA